MGALLLGVRDVLLAGLNLQAGYADVRPSGKPSPLAHELYVAIHPGPSKSGKTESLVEEYDVSVTITRRVNGWPPDDRTGAELLLRDADGDGPSYARAGMYPLKDAIKALLHVQYDPLHKANTYLGDSQAGHGSGVFQVPLFYRGCTEPREVGSDWFGAEAAPGVAGLTMALSFGGAKRVQNITGQD